MREIVYKFPYNYLRNIQMFNKIHEKNHRKNVNILHAQVMQNFLKITYIQQKCIITHAKH